MLHNFADWEQESTLLLPRCVEVRRAGFAIHFLLGAYVRGSHLFVSGLSWFHPG